MRYLIRQRLHAARHDLLSSDRAAGAIALDLGFYDQSAFTRAFREAAGVTPAKYREQHLRELEGSRIRLET